MLLIILYYILVSVACLVTGFYAHLWLQALHPEDSTQGSGKSAIVYALWGLITVTLLTQIAALFFPIDGRCRVAWVILLVLGSLVHKQAFLQFYDWMRADVNTNAYRITGCCVILLFVGTLGAGPLMMDDTESYHIQALRWLQTYGTVPGLANLHERYGFNSSWFSFAAVLIPGPTASNFYTVANGLISVWFLLYLMNAAFSKTSGFSPAWSLGCFAVLVAALGCWPMVRGNASTANYDFITTCTIVVLMLELCKAGQSNGAWKKYTPEIIIWPAFLFSVRIINFPVLLICLFGCIHLLRNKNYKLLTATLLYAAALVVPFLIRNVVLSGYLFFPVYQIDWFAVDWKADAARTRQLVDYIKYFNRINTGIMPISESRKLGSPAWIRPWFGYLFGYDKPVLLAGTGGYILCLVRYRQAQLSLAIKVGIVAMVMQMAAWFVIAPDPRFVYGPLLSGIFLLVWLLPAGSIAGIYLKLRGLLEPLLFAGMLAFTLLKILNNADYANFITPVRIPAPATRLVRIGSLRLHIPERISGNWNPRCYATDLPCLYEVQPGLKMRGPTIARGFKIER